MEDLKLYFVTYNVGTSNPDQSLLDLLSLSSNPKNDKKLPDFYIIGLQEVSAQPHNMLMDVLYDDPWTKALKEILSDRSYVKVSSIRLQGLVLNVFTLRKHLLNVQKIETNYTRTGLAGMWGNKGGVSVRLEIYGCTICFVNAHLCAHDNQLDERMVDYNSIVKAQQFHASEHQNIFYHDYVFWMGDLNFRLKEDYGKSPEEIEIMIKKGALGELFKYDQLKQVRETKHIELDENPPPFAPTYKFEVGESVPKYDLKRRPAWTDRILYKVHNNYENVTLSAEQKSYVSHPSYTLSDHKPVTAEFNVKVFSNYEEEVIKFDEIENWWDNEENIVKYEFTKNHTVEKNDWIGIYKFNFDALDEYEAYEYVAKSMNPGKLAASANEKYTITFSQPTNKNQGLYQLVYISEDDNKVRSTLGISNVFMLRAKAD